MLALTLPRYVQDECAQRVLAAHSTATRAARFRSSASTATHSTEFAASSSTSVTSNTQQTPDESHAPHRRAAYHPQSAVPSTWTRGSSVRASSLPMTCGSSPLSARMASTASLSSGATTSTMPMPQLKVRSISVAPEREPAASQSNTGSGFHDFASNVAPIPSGSTRGRFSSKPPPVMWASAFTLPSLVGVRRAVPTDWPGAKGAGESQDRPERSTTLRTREKPLEWTPEEGTPMSTSPEAMESSRGSRSVRLTAPTAKPARS
eukprot:6214246-Pleurochrysis_carterae.AAC.4